VVPVEKEGGREELYEYTEEEICRGREGGREGGRTYHFFSVGVAGEVAHLDAVL